MSPPNVPIFDNYIGGCWIRSTSGRVLFVNVEPSMRMACEGDLGLVVSVITSIYVDVSGRLQRAQIDNNQ